MLSRLKNIPYEFHVNEGKSTNELLDELVEAMESESQPKRRSFTDDELEAFCRLVILKLLNKAINEHGIDSIKELIQEIEEPDDAGDEWKDE